MKNSLVNIIDNVKQKNENLENISKERSPLDEASITVGT